MKIIKYTVNFLTKTSNILAYIAENLRQMNLHEEYYVYVPNANKPRYRHKSYKSAKQEALRLASELSNIDEIEILQIVNRFYGDNIPF